MENKRHIASYNFLGKPSFLCNTPIYYEVIKELKLDEIREKFTKEMFEMFVKMHYICKNCLRIYLKKHQRKRL